MFYSGCPRKSNPSSFSLLTLVGNSDLEGVMYISNIALHETGVEMGFRELWNQEGFRTVAVFFQSLRKSFSIVQILLARRRFVGSNIHLTVDSPLYLRQLELRGSHPRRLNCRCQAA